MKITLIIILYLILAPVAGFLLMGIDRIITARMQKRYGPPLLQPLYDVLKLFQKETIVVRKNQNLYILFYLIFMIFTGVLFFSGQDILLVVFSITVASIFFVLAGYKVGSPFSHIGAERELLQIMSYEPMLLLAVIGMSIVTKSFMVSDIASFDLPLIQYTPGLFLGLIFILTIKLRKSPFDLSTSHHGHQELVKGITTEFSGKALAMIEIAHWYETVILLGFIYLFFAYNPLLAIIAMVVVYFFEILIDNTFARAKWQYTVASSWIVTMILGFGNLIYISLFMGS